MGDRTLSIDDLCEVSDELETAALKWRRLGLALGLKSYRLDLIGADNSETLDCFTKMLGDWLKNTLPEPTWGDLAEALDSIGERRLARRVRVKYCGFEGLTPAELEAVVQPHNRLQGKQNQRALAVCYKVFLLLVPLIIILSLSSYLIYSAFSKSHLSHSCGMPYLTTDVIGRDTDAANVTKLINFDNSIMRIVSIVGPPGIGKSTLAKYVGHNLVQNSRVVVYYIDMNGVTNVPAMTEKLLTCASVHNEELESRDVLKKWAYANSQHTLLLLDNADEILQTQWNNFETIIQILIESSPYIKVLITSQKKPFYVYLSPVYKEVSLSMLHTQYACTLLHKMTSSLTAQQAEIIAELTGNMPLALTVIGALIKQLSHNPYTPDIIIDKLRKEPFSTFSQTRHINASISVSYEYLDNQLKRFIHFIANFPESFDDVSVTEIMKAYTKSPITRSEVSEMLQSLSKLSLLEYNGKQNRYNFHSVIKTYISGIREVAVIDRVRFSIAFQHYYLQVLANLSQTHVNDHITAITSLYVEQHNIVHFLCLFETLLHVNHTIYCRALDSIQLVQSKGLIPCIDLNSQTPDTTNIIVEFIQWHTNIIKGLVEVSVLLDTSEYIYSHVKLPIIRMLNIGIQRLKQFLRNAIPELFINETQSSSYVSIGDAYHILDIDSKSLQFYQLALTHQQLHIIQQFYVNIRLYEIYVRTNSNEKAETILHELVRLCPAMESVPASSYIEYQYEMREIIRFLNRYVLSRADTVIEQEILIVIDQLQVNAGCNNIIHFYTWDTWKELIHRKTHRRDFNEAAELGTTVIRVYESQSECQVPIHLIVSHIYYYTGIAMYGSNGSVDYLQRTLDVTNSEFGHYYFGGMRLRVCWILVSHGHLYCIKQFILQVTCVSLKRNQSQYWITRVITSITIVSSLVMIISIKVALSLCLEKKDLCFTLKKLFLEKKIKCFTLITTLSIALIYYQIFPSILILLNVLLMLTCRLTKWEEMHSYTIFFAILGILWEFIMATYIATFSHPLYNIHCII